jgi:uncharacterized protein (TIGR03000 family)
MYSCTGGLAFEGSPMPFPATGPTFEPSPYGVPTPYTVPGAIPPIRTPGLEGVPFAPNTPAPVIEDRSALGTQPPSPTRATVVVKLPADARLYAEGRLLQLTSAERTFVTPELPTGREYSYTFKVEYDRNGETVALTRKIAVQPGKTTPLEFADLTAKAAPSTTELATKPASVTPPAKPVEAAPAKDAEKPGNPFQGPAATPVSSERARLTLKIPAGATLYIDDKKKDGSDAVREFTTPPLPAGKEFAYVVTVEITRNGLPERLMEKVTFRAGDNVTRDFATLMPGGR